MTSALCAQGVVRNDLAEPLQKIFCDEGHLASPLVAWQHGIFDAQIQGRLLELRNPAKKQLVQSQVGNDLKKSAFHRATVAGECGKERVWVASVPASKPLAQLNDGRLRIDGAAIAQSCRRLKVEHAPAEVGDGRTILLNKNPSKAQDLFVNLKFLDKGTVSVTCYPIQPKWAGPVLWYLFPTGGGPGPEVPAHELLRATAALDDVLINWVNALRLMHGLPTMVAGQGKIFSQVLVDFSQSKSVAHNRRKIGKAREALESAGYRFIGENRVRGQSSADLAWLLWNSPSHRKLLLKKDARNINVAINREGGELFAVLLVTRERTVDPD